MTKRLALRKRFIVLFFFAILLAIQIVSVRSWHYTYFSYFLQTSILDIAIMLGIYAFKGFGNSTIRSLNVGFVSYIFGTILGSLLAVLIVLIFFYPRIPRNVFIITDMISAFIFPILSYLFMKIIIKKLPVKKYLVIGKENEFGGIMNEIEKASMEKILVYRYMNPSVTVLKETIELSEKDGLKMFDSLLIADPSLVVPVSNVIDKASKKGISIEYLPVIVENSLHRIPIEVLEKFNDYYKIFFSSIQPSHLIRILDVFFSVTALIIFSPVVLFSIMYIYIRDGKPLLFTQKRLGMNKKIFNVYKFRTMDNPTDKIENKEPQITKSGKLLRLTRLNEIPQLFNVIKGEMGIVGPRPDILSTYHWCVEKIPFYDYRTKIPQGITGHAQVMFHYVDKLEYGPFARRLSYDLYYVKNKNVGLYFTTIIRTLEVMLFRRGSK